MEVRQGRLELIEESNRDVATEWVSLVTPAYDRYEQNCEVFRDGRGLVYLRSLRALGDGEELFLWYSPELARDMNIPVLTPTNIRGKLLN